MQLFTIQKRIIRLITYADYNCSTDNLFKMLDILPLQKLVYYRIGIMMYKYSNGSLPNVLNDLYMCNNEVHSYNTRHNKLLHIIKGTINVYTKSFANTSARIWNCIQLNINTHASAYVFKLNLKKFLQCNSLQLFYPK